MESGKGRAAYWFPITLAVAGSLALLFGVFVAVLSIPEVVAAAHFNTAPASQSALYVGASTCFTCHSDRQWDWSLTLYTQTVVDPTENPQAVTHVAQDDRVQVMGAGQMVEAYTTADTLTTQEQFFHQHYVIRTEDGRLLLPGKGHGVLDDAGEAGLGGAMAQCSLCHTASLQPDTLDSQLVGRLETRQVTLQVGAGSDAIPMTRWLT